MRPFLKYIVVKEKGNSRGKMKSTTRVLKTRDVKNILVGLPEGFQPLLFVVFSPDLYISSYTIKCAFIVDAAFRLRSHSVDDDDEIVIDFYSRCSFFFFTNEFFRRANNLKNMSCNKRHWSSFSARKAACSTLRFFSCNFGAKKVGFLLLFWSAMYENSFSTFNFIEELLFVC